MGRWQSKIVYLLVILFLITGLNAWTGPNCLGDSVTVVMRLYAQVLERAPESDGVQYWTREFDEHRRTVKEAVRWFAKSPDHEKRFLYGPLVVALYLQLLNRDPEEGGFETHTKSLLQGATVRELVRWVAHQPEYTKLHITGKAPADIVEELYLTLLARHNPDAQATQNWIREATNHGGASPIAGDQGGWAWVIDSFIETGPEYRDRFGDNEVPGHLYEPYRQGIRNLYRHVLAREAAFSDIENWRKEQAKSGWDHVIDEFLGLGEYDTYFGANSVPGRPIPQQLGARAALQSCIDHANPGSAIELPATIYVVDSPVVVSKSLTIRTAGAADALDCMHTTTACATLRASPSSYPESGFLHLVKVEGVTLDHIVLDGDRLSRLDSAAAADCQHGHNRHGFNASASQCTHCSFVHSVSMNALCGTAFEWEGDDATITNSAFVSNGDHSTNQMWSDGLTITHSDRAKVVSNTFRDNSDVGLIVGGSINSEFRNNVIVQQSQAAFAGLMLDNFANPGRGDFTGAVFSDNSVECAALRCDFGIEIGPHPWYGLDTSLHGGTVTRNRVSGAKQGINVEGAGTQLAPLTLFGNQVVGAPGEYRFNCGQRNTSLLNISPDSVVDRKNDAAHATREVWHICP